MIGYGDYEASIHLLMPQGTNSTHFTSCCGSAITDSERFCPSCEKKVLGADAESDHERGRIRWKYATSNWRSHR